MPTLRDSDFKISYGPGDDRLNRFFIPALAVSVRYDRAAGYFSSSMLAVAAAGVVKLIASGGTMRLLCGADLSEEDVEAIKAGHQRLADAVARRMKARLALPEDDYVKNRVQALAWLVGTGQLQIQVVLPKGPDGHPLPGSQAEAYYHPKEGIFTDAEGNQVAFSGSINESATALVENYESFLVVTSWQTPQYVSAIQTRFEKLWSGRDRDWIALPIPEAAKQELLKLRANVPPTHDALERPAEKVDQRERPEPLKVPDTVEQERIIFQFLRDAPKLLGAGPLGAATSTVRPWPHQQRVVKAVIERFPEPAMLCDEVGLGKTIEAGLVLRELLLSSRVQRALILVPKSVLRQWQEELYEKFALNIPRYDGQLLRDIFDREMKVPAGTNPWTSRPVLLASSHLAKRRERQQQLAEAGRWDLLIIDEAHHARRKDFLNREQFRPNRLLELLHGTQHIPGLKDRTRGLILLTATPMQIDPLEVWDLLKVMGLGGRWGAGEENFLHYFDELRRPIGEIDWTFVAPMLRDYFTAGGTWDESFCRVAEEKLGPAVWDQVKALPSAANPETVLRRLPAQAHAVVLELARRHTPLRRYLFRNTRELLRVYRDKGLLKENIPYRDPRQVWIDMRPDEWDLYRRIEEYIRHHYQKYEAERKGLGFIMTVYRRRLTSSFHAIAQSLRRRRDFLRGQLELSQLLAEDDAEQEDLDLDVSEELFADMDPDERQEFVELCWGEIDYLEDFLARLKSLGTDSKVERLTADLRDMLQKRDSVLVFTQYTDTMDYLRDRLREVYGSQVACYSGRGGERWQDGQWVTVSKESIKTAFRSSQEIKILLCTESASEGLNLQTCGVLINYDMPWNPMRVEQRIGRIDRIGQSYDRVWVRNYFYERTVEADIYHRLDERIGSFEHVVGELQPILARVARAIETAAMAGEARREQVIAQEVAHINQAVRSAEAVALNLDRLVDTEAAAPEPEHPPITLSELERALVESAALRARFLPHPTIAGAHLLDWNGQVQPVTFDPAVYDDHPNTLQLVTYGSELLNDILASVDAPTERPDQGHILRLHATTPVERVGWYTSLADQVQPITSLGALRAALAVETHPSVLADSAITAARTLFDRAYRPFCDAAIRATQAQERGRAETLAEEIRDHLLQAAYVELARTAEEGMFASDGGAGFSLESVRRLRCHKYPFAGALKLVSIDELILSPADPKYQRITQARGNTLDRRFESIRNRLRELLEQYVATSSAERSPDPGNPPAVEMTVTRYGVG
jgi:superfamily II DNA or RNA helicase